MKANRKGVGWFISILEERVRIHVYMFNNGHYYILQLKIKMEFKIITIKHTRRAI